MVEFVKAEVEVITQKPTLTPSKNLLRFMSLIHFLSYQILFLSFIFHSGVVKTILFVVFQIFLFNALFKRSNLNNNQSIILILCIVNFITFGLLHWLTLFNLVVLVLLILYVQKLIELKNGR